MRLRDTLKRYYETTNSDPRHATREDIAAAEAAWTAEQRERAANLVPRAGTWEERAERSLVSAVRAWLALEVDDATEELEDAMALYDLRLARDPRTDTRLKVTPADLARDGTVKHNDDFWLAHADWNTSFVASALELAGEVTREACRVVRDGEKPERLLHAIVSSGFAERYADAFALTLPEGWQEQLRKADDGFKMFSGGHSPEDRVRVLGMAGLRSEVAKACEDTGWDP